ncbi:MAG TPA: conjugal transfer protein TraR [Desulfotomaculum sp.]|nr:conjugal transfer protein TraR [Desulfotomaculum sp.]
MDEAEQAYFKERLMREREELRRRLEGVDETGLAMPLRESTGELSLYDNHPADVASELFERSKDLALKEDAELKLKAVNDALAKMEAGRYGNCEVCGSPIPLARLKAVPYTTMCLRCKEKQEEQEERKRIRPVEETVLRTPWTRPEGESIIYDQEDAWQDVAQHGLSTETEELEEEDRSAVADVDEIPYYKSDGLFYRDDRVGEGRPADERV